MKRLTKLTAAVAIATASLTASAWWGPGYPDGFYGSYGNAPALTSEQKTAFEAQQKAWIDAQQKSFQQAMEAQRQYMDQMTRYMEAQQKAWLEAQQKAFQQDMETQRQYMEQLAKNPQPVANPSSDPFMAGLDRDIDAFDPMGNDPIFSALDNDPVELPIPSNFKERMEKAQARHEKIRKEMSAHREDMKKQYEARREELQKQFDSRRDEMKKQIESHRKSLSEKVSALVPVKAPVPKDI